MSIFESDHERYLLKALAEASHCTPIQTAFCVGCILVTRLPKRHEYNNIDNEGPPIILSTGYSRELPGNTHAEANALTKAYNLSQSELVALFPSFLSSSASAPPSVERLFPFTDVYTTLEPCSIRTSGLPACADALIKAKIRRCIIGVGEPDDFVKCEGAQKMKDAGIEVVWYKGLETECLAAARRGHDVIA
ncbi:diaminohydroxyphosphoribosylamino-pyrimidine deaminase [Phlebopus sp. FC_14]|nr:diaminohydroxyphosphoribosylamino-pyrimidine deaminase [Phlebopus sp. FC_14]